MKIFDDSPLRNGQSCRILRRFSCFFRGNKPERQDPGFRSFVSRARIAPCGAAPFCPSDIFPVSSGKFKDQDNEKGFFVILSFLSAVMSRTISFCHPDPTRKAYPGRISKGYLVKVSSRRTFRTSNENLPKSAEIAAFWQGSYYSCLAYHPLNSYPFLIGIYGAGSIFFPQSKLLIKKYPPFGSPS